MKIPKLPLALYGLSVLLVALVWWALGRPVPMPALAGDKVSLPCLSYAPFRGDQSPLVGNVQIERAQIADDLAHLATRTACIRTYGVNHGTHVVPELAKEAGLKVMLGIWLGADPASNRAQIATAIDLARRYPEVLSAVVVGNEVLLRGEMTPPALGAAIREVKAAVSVPVTYADVPEFWLRHPELAEAVDFITIHLLPYWEDFPTPVAAAVAHAEASRQKILAAFPGKRVFVGEIGWPSAGRMREGALPSRVNQARFFHEVMALAEREQFGVNLIEAFDQPWKRQREGTVGGYWGLFDAAAREAKFAWGQPVSNHPFWAWQAGLGVLLASLAFLAAAWSARGSGEDKGMAWLGVAAIALVSGTAIGWAVEAMWVESLGLAGWLRSVGWVAVATLAPVAGAALLLAGRGVPPLYRVLGPTTAWPRDRRALVTGLILAGLLVLAIQTALMLVFDPRYVDIPFAGLIGALMPFVILALVPNQGILADGQTPRPGSAAGEKLASTGSTTEVGGLGSIRTQAETAKLRRSASIRPPAEKTAAVILALSAVYIVLAEGVANWQALSFSVALGVLALTLVRGRAEPD
jgi:glucan 1,3-beta-glucosidase